MFKKICCASSHGVRSGRGRCHILIRSRIKKEIFCFSLVTSIFWVLEILFWIYFQWYVNRWINKSIRSDCNDEDREKGKHELLRLKSKMGYLQFELNKLFDSNSCCFPGFWCSCVVISCISASKILSIGSKLKLRFILTCWKTLLILWIDLYSISHILILSNSICTQSL